ncbi:hypothetical protein QBC40DRAFT_321350 [Triangularia verruculosa]|uniref:Uncharacterized protein n=1 Tax=Triangularia verruculosa TaxID=2587418 RepID=A0AAN6XL03_9PEZI|nr:hypothetical protein QBC40DRAFT_321350 [Triangularia verruculosa]
MLCCGRGCGCAWRCMEMQQTLDLSSLSFSVGWFWGMAWIKQFDVDARSMVVRTAVLSGQEPQQIKRPVGFFGRSGFPTTWLAMRLVWTKEVSQVSSSVKGPGKADKAFLSWRFFLFSPATVRPGLETQECGGALCRLINHRKLRSNLLPPVCMTDPRFGHPPLSCSRLETALMMQPERKEVHRDQWLLPLTRPQAASPEFQAFLLPTPAPPPASLQPLTKDDDGLDARRIMRIDRCFRSQWPATSDAEECRMLLCNPRRASLKKPAPARVLRWHRSGLTSLE